MVILYTRNMNMKSKTQDWLGYTIVKLKESRNT